MFRKCFYTIGIVALISGGNPSCLCAGDAQLNRFGHILTEELSIWQYEETGVEGYSFIRTESGRLVFNHNEDFPLTEIEYFDQDGQSVYSMTFKSVINLKLSPRCRYAAFSDVENLVVLEIASGDVQRFPASTLFAIDDKGRPAFYNPHKQIIQYGAVLVKVNSRLDEILFWQSKIVVAVDDYLYTIEADSLQRLNRFDGKIFELKTSDNCLLVSVKQQHGREYRFSLYQTEDLITYNQIDEAIFQQPMGIDTHEEIRAPLHYYESSFPSIVKNAYAQIQEWSHAYLHPGVDLFEEPYTEVYSVADGIVRAIITTGDEQYWRIAIERFDVPGEGYLYAHLNQNSFPFAVGDSVAAGDIVGTLYPAYNFSPHVHFVRISPVGTEWNGVWWVMDNPLVDITNMIDSIPPVFENALGSDLFAFRDSAGYYLDPMNLSGEIDIIAKCLDYAYEVDFYSRIVPYDLKFQLYSILNPDSVVYERYGFALDMPLDTYFDIYYYTLVLNTIYSRDATCFSTNDNSNRDFFFILTNSNGDSVITEEDSFECFDTTQLPDGAYLLKVTMRDAALNETAQHMGIVINNGVPVMPSPDLSFRGNSIVLCECNPNPANPVTTITIELPVSEVIELSVYNVLGSKTAQVANGLFSAGRHYFHWDAANLSSGIYLIKLEAGGQTFTKRAAVLK